MLTLQIVFNIIICLLSIKLTTVIFEIPNRHIFNIALALGVQVTLFILLFLALSFILVDNFDLLQDNPYKVLFYFILLDIIIIGPIVYSKVFDINYLKSFIMALSVAIITLIMLVMWSLTLKALNTKSYFSQLMTNQRDDIVALDKMATRLCQCQDTECLGKNTLLFKQILKRIEYDKESIDYHQKSLIQELGEMGLSCITHSIVRPLDFNPNTIHNLLPLSITHQSKHITTSSDNFEQDNDNKLPEKTLHIVSIINLSPYRGHVIQIKRKDGRLHEGILINSNDQTITIQLNLSSGKAIYKIPLREIKTIWRYTIQ